MGYSETLFTLPKETAMSDFPFGKIILALIFIFVIVKATVILMWTLIAGVAIWMVHFVQRDPDTNFTAK